MYVVGAVMGFMESHGVLDDWYRAMWLTYIRVMG